MKEIEILSTLDNLTRLIYSTLKEIAVEQRYPGMDPEEVTKIDIKLKRLKERYYRLVKLRFDFEMTCTDVTLTNTIIDLGQTK